jgi:hypothetical protein
MGAIALLVPYVIERLQLTDSQQLEIERCAEVTISQAAKGNTGPFAVLSLAHTARQARSRALEILTAEQREAWQSLANLD